MPYNMTKCIWVNQVSLGLEATSRGLIQLVILSGPLLRDGVSCTLRCDYGQGEVEVLGKNRYTTLAILSSSACHLCFPLLPMFFLFHLLFPIQYYSVELPG